MTERTSRWPFLGAMLMFPLYLCQAGAERSSFAILLNFILCAAAVLVVGATQEAVRYFSALLMGLSVPAIHIGTGRPLHRFAFGSTNVWLHAWPAFGWSRLTSPRRHVLLVIRLMLTAVPPAFTTWVALGFLDLYLPRPDVSLGLVLNHTVSPCAALEFACVASIPVMLFRIVRFVVGPDLDQRVVDHLVSTGDRRALQKELDRGGWSRQHEVELRHALGSAWIRARHYAEALHMLRADLERPSRPTLHASMRGNAALAALMLFDRTLLDDADEWSAAALATTSTPETRGTRGLYLVMAGQAEEALPLLENPAALAAAHAQLGQLDQARACLAQATALDPTSDLIPWAKQEIARHGGITYRA